MKTTIHFIILWGLALGLVTVGCSSRANRGTPGPQKSNSQPTGARVGSQETPEAARPSTIAAADTQKIESVVRLVLDAHGFVPPMFIEGTGDVRWAISTRPGSDRELVLGAVKMAPGGDISAELRLYAHIGSTWALLGPQFSGMADQEARDMNKQIRDRLAK